MLNYPNNPTGLTLSRAQLEEISVILEDYPHVWVLSDEIYENISWGPEQHVPFASLRNNWSKTISLYSGGKTFSATGWKIGWVVAEEDLIVEMTRLHNPLGFCFNSTGQVAMGRSLHTVFHEPYEGAPHYGAYLCDMF